MSNIASTLEHFRFALTVLRRDTRGVTAVEYALIAGLMATAVTAAFVLLSGGITTALGKITF